MSISTMKLPLTTLCEALGLDGRHIRKIVLECEINSIVTLYVQEFPTQDKLDALTAALAKERVKVMPVEDVQVSDRCEVVHSPARA